MEATFEELLVKKEKQEFKKRETLLGSIYLKKITNAYHKRVKKRQMKKRIKSLKLSLKNMEELFSASLTDPTMDSVDLKMKARSIERELNMTKDLYRQLFYNRFVLFLIKLFTKNPKK